MLQVCELLQTTFRPNESLKTPLGMQDILNVILQQIALCIAAHQIVRDLFRGARKWQTRA
jgi:hypothetical protein